MDILFIINQGSTFLSPIGRSRQQLTAAAERRCCGCSTRGCGGSCVHRHVCRWGCLQNVQPDYIARPSNLPARTGCSAHQPFASICFTIIRTTLSLVVVRHVLCAFCVAGLAVCCTRCCVVIVVGAAIMLSCCLLVLSLYAVSLMVCCPCLSLHWVICSCDP